MLDHLLAKTKDRESLGTHTGLVLKAWGELRQRYGAVLGEHETFWFDSFVAALFHDFGKASLNFQNMLFKVLKEPILEKGFEPIRHELLSGILLGAHSLYRVKRRLIEKPEYAVLYAVLTHHKDFNTSLFQRDAINVRQWKIRDSDALEFFSYARNWFEKEYPSQVDYLNGIDLVWQWLQQQSVQNLLDCKDQLVEPFLGWLKDNCQYDYRRTYLMQKAMLVIADWTASGHRSIEQELHFDTELVRQKVAERVAKAKGTFIGFREFQKKSANIPGNVLAIAPTGSGKTEAALLWASQREGYEKIVYFLPTRVTANVLFKRLDDFFGMTTDPEPERYTAVVHSSAKLFRLDLDENYQSLDYLRESAFFKAVTVGTVDQLLTQGFNLGWWEMKTFHLFRARVILDEIHAYAPYTLGLIVATIRYLRQHFQTQFYIMTATMPKKLQTLLSRELGLEEHEILRDQELLEKKRNQFSVTEKTVDQLRPDIERDLKAGRKVLIVVNTVDEAIRLYDAYDGFQRICYHSRFIVKHRTSKEESILKNEENAPNEGFLLIATQVVEVSLDIDYHALYTENAPIDAIIQRAGRVNRKRRKTLGKIIVFPHSAKAEEFIYTSPAGILTTTFDVLKKYDEEALSEQDLLNMVEEVYGDWNVQNDAMYQDALTKYERLLHDKCGYVYDFSDDLEQVFTREGLDTINVIPDCYKAELAGKSILEKSKHEVAIRNHRFKSGKHTTDQDHSWFKYFDCEYDIDHGLRFKKKDETPLTVIL